MADSTGGAGDRPLRLVTWNVNSLRARLPRVLDWLASAEPDVVCLQETKVADAAFPTAPFEALGYEVAAHGDGQWNGVALLSRRGLVDVRRGFGTAVPGGPLADAAGCRLVAADCGGVRVHSVYVPNGRQVGSPHFEEKLSWLAALEALLAATCHPEEPVAVCGDMNVAPADDDVWNPAALEGATHVTDAERRALGRLEAWGLVDVVRRCHPEPGLFSWWDYRGGAFHRRRGMRIDLVLVTEPLAARCRLALIDRNARKGPQPSDHAPVLVDLELPRRSEGIPDGPT
jgi:exodeoxyribonuclease-3